MSDTVIFANRIPESNGQEDPLEAIKDAIAFGASSTRMAIAHTDGPWLSLNCLGKPLPSPFRMKLIPPWRNSVTFLERCIATGAKPRLSNTRVSAEMSGPVNSTNSKPRVPIGLKSLSAAMAQAPGTH